MNNFYRILIILFLLLMGGIYLASREYPLLDTTLLYGGNIILAFITGIAFYLAKRNMSGNANAFIRGVYSGTLLKMMVLIIALVSYVMVNASNLHKPSLFVIFGLYIVYAALETRYLGAMAKRSK